MHVPMILLTLGVLAGGLSVAMMFTGDWYGTLGLGASVLIIRKALHELRRF